MGTSDAEKSNAILREMYRTSLDSIRVYNPTVDDFIVVWDGFKHIIPARTRDMGFGLGNRILPRYLAMKYVREMKDKLVNEAADNYVKQLIREAPEDMKAKYESDPFEKQRLYDRAPKTSDEKQIKKYFNVLWIGVEERYGITDVVDESDGIQDPRTIEEQILADMNKPVTPIKKEDGTELTPVEVPTEKKFPINAKKKQLEQEVAQ